MREKGHSTLVNKSICQDINFQDKNQYTIIIHIPIL